MRADRYREESETKKKKKKGPLKVLLILILILLAAIAGATAYFYLAAYNSLSLTFTEESPVVEFGEDYPAMSFVSDSTGDVEPSGDSLDTAYVGESEMIYSVRKPILGGMLTPSKDFTLSYAVEDSVPPLKMWSGDGALIERGSEFDINSIISYGDNADPSPSVTVDGKVDTEKNGKYPLHVNVSDASGNSTGWDLTVEVTDEIPAYEDTEERTAFADFVSAYKGKGRSFGIDVSAWQDEIDFDAVKKAGCEFVIIRIGYTSDGEINVDKTFYRNIRDARDAGLKIGVYVYSTDSTEEQVRKTAEWVVETLEGENLDLPIAFDWEDFGSFQNYKISLYELNNLYDAFADEISKSGYGCMLYGSKNYLENAWKKTDVRPVWLAHYTEKTDYEGPYMLWQASCTGKISGIGGDVDLDILYTKN